MYSTVKSLVFLSMVASSLAVKCFVCSSAKLDSKASDDYKKTVAYTVRACQKDDGTCNAENPIKQFTIAEYYLGDSCSNFDSRTLNVSDSKNIVDCKLGCIKINTMIEDRGEEVSRVTRQCAYGEEAKVSGLLDSKPFKRTAAGSDKVLNWFYYCGGEYCNAAAGVHSSWALAVAVTYAAVAMYQ